MLSKIEALRKKPKYVRNMYAFWGAVGATSVIALVWATTLPSRVDVLADQEGVREEVSGFSAFVRDISASVQTSVANIRSGVAVYQAEEGAIADPVATEDSPLRFESYSTSTSTSTRQDLLRSAVERARFGEQSQTAPQER